MHRQNFHYNNNGNGGQASTTMTNEQAIAAAMIENDAAALAAEMFDHFSSAVTMRQILGLFRNMCDTIGVRSAPINEFYPKLKAKIKNWKAQALWKKFDARLSHRVYNKGTACSGIRVLVIGSGPCGLRTAIEAQLLGAKVVLVEKRDRITRNNVLHLWPFLIHDLRSLGAKKFYGKFCAGSIDHISIRQLQCILLKVALLLGVEIHEGVSFDGLIEPSDGCGWRAKTSPSDHAVSHFEFDAILGADGKRNTLEGFNRKEFRGKLAIAITANFINRRTEEEARVEEISGVAFIFNQSFFKELYHQTGIDLENIVYYKDETHYFVMTAKKHSLLDKGVIIQDFSDPAELLHPNNVNTMKLQDYAREAADFSTKYQMPCLEFAVNHYGKPDVAMFDFTSMFAAENSSRIVVRRNYRLLMCIVGDSLLEPFWPSGSGCARGFLSGMDAAYAVKLMANPNNSLLSVLSQRESIYRLLAQTTPENLHRDHSSYTLDPMTRYPNLNRQFVLPHQMKHLLDTDDPSLLDQTFMDTNVIQSLPEPPLKTRKRRTADTTPMANVLLAWIKSHLKDQEFASSLVEPSQIFTHGKVLCALINRYRPDLCDWSSIENTSSEESNEIAFRIFEKEFKIPRIMSADESLTLQDTDIKVWLHYLEQICEVFRGEIPHVKHPKLDYAEFKQKNQPTNRMADFAKLHRIAAAKREAANEENGATNGRKSRDKLPTSPPPQNVEHRRGRKRRSYEKYGGNIEERMARLADIDANRIDRHNRRREHRKLQTENFYKSLHMLQAANYMRESGNEDSSAAFEDYSIFMYRQNAPEFTDRVKELEMKLLFPDRERGIPSAMPRTGGNVLDDKFSDRIRNIEDKFTTKNAAVTNKKPKDLLRAIGKIESNDWNVKEIEKKMEMSKKIHDIGKSREKVPKWNREQFVARQTKMQKPERQDEVKYKEIDETIKALDKQLKEGSVLDRGERGRNKVAQIAAATFGKKKESENNQQAKAGLILTSQGVSEACHFCKQRVYLMEKINAEGLVLHRSCLKCHHCHTNLRLGGYAFDRENPDGKFYCTQHFKLPPKDSKFVPKRLQHKQRQAEYAAFKAQHQQKQQDRKSAEGDALDNRGKTPERIEFENADDEPIGEQEMDENEWTDLNFGTGDEDSVDDESSSDESDSDTDSEIFEDPVGVDAQTLQLASEWIDKRSTLQDSEDEFYGYSSEDDDADSQTEGEELAKAREMRMNEVKLQPPPPTYILTDTETEAVKKFSELTQNIENINDNCSLVDPTPSTPNNNNNNNNNPKDELLKHDMMKKLSLKEKWLNEQPKPSISIEQKVTPMEIDEHAKKKDEKKSFFDGILSSVKHFIKHEKHESKKKSPSPSPPSLPQKVDVENFDDLIESEQPKKGNTERKIKKFLQKQKSDEVRDEADDILNDIKEEKDRLEKHMRDMEQKRFSDNMQAIKSSVAESKVASMKEVNLSKYFPKQKDKKPPAVAKNRDVKALKDVNLSKYFPSSSSSPTPGKASPVNVSATSSATQSPLTPRKNINEIDLANYFPGTPVVSRKTSTVTPPSSPLTENPPITTHQLARKDSITRYVVANTIPANPPPPAPKKNILSLQTIKKRSVDESNKKENLAQNQQPVVVVAATAEFKLGTPKDKKKKNDFNMFDQLLDGAIDIEPTIDNFDALIDDELKRMERSPSKEYEKIFHDVKTPSSKEISSEKPAPLQSNKINDDKNNNNANDEMKMKKSSKRKSPKKTKNDLVDKFNIDPRIIQSLSSEYQRLLVELERSSKSPESNEKVIEISTNKRKSPQPNDDCKKFKENEEEEESIIARLEKKYRRCSLKSNEEDKEVLKMETTTTTEIKVEKPTSVIERLEQKWKQRRAAEENDPKIEIIHEPPKLESISLVKQQELSKQDELKNQHEKLLPTRGKQEMIFFDDATTTTKLPKENIDDILSEFQLTEMETEKALREFQENFDLLTNNNNNSRRGSLKKANDEETLRRFNEIDEADGYFNEKSRISNKPPPSPPRSKIPVKSSEIVVVEERRKSLQIDLVEIDSSISERPLNINDLFGNKKESNERENEFKYENIKASNENKQILLEKLDKESKINFDELLKLNKSIDESNKTVKADKNAIIERKNSLKEAKKDETSRRDYAQMKIIENDFKAYENNNNNKYESQPKELENPPTIQRRGSKKSSPKKIEDYDIKPNEAQCNKIDTKESKFNAKDYENNDRNLNVNDYKIVEKLEDLKPKEFERRGSKKNSHKADEYDLKYKENVSSDAHENEFMNDSKNYYSEEPLQRRGSKKKSQTSTNEEKFNVNDYEENLKLKELELVENSPLLQRRGSKKSSRITDEYEKLENNLSSMDYRSEKKSQISANEEKLKLNELELVENSPLLQRRGSKKSSRNNNDKEKEPDLRITENLKGNSIENLTLANIQRRGSKTSSNAYEKCEEYLLRQNNDVINSVQLSAHDKDEKMTHKDIINTQSIDKKTSALPSNYINILKEISSELIGFDEEPLIFMRTHHPQKANMNVAKEPSLVNEKINENYANVLQDINFGLIGSDFYDKSVETVEKKNYSQIIPPNVQDPKSMIDSTDFIQLPPHGSDRLRDFDSTETDLIDIKVPIAPPRKNKPHIEDRFSPDSLNERRRKILSPTRSDVDYDTMSGISSTEYFDHYYSVAHMDKIETPTPAVVVKDKPKYDDTPVKYSVSNRNYTEKEKTPVRKASTSHYSIDKQDYESKVLSDRSKMLHRRKEDFMLTRDLGGESTNNPYIREMLRQDVENPLNIRDIKFIRKHPTVPLLTSSVSTSAERYQPRKLSSPILSSPRAQQLSYTRSSTSSSYLQRPSTYRPSSYTPTTTSASTTASHIMTKAHTLTPPSNYNTSSYTSARNRGINSYSDPISRATSSSRPLGYNTKSSREACVIS